MNTHRSLYSTSDAGSRFSVSPVQGIHGRSYARLLLVALAAMGVSACPRPGVAGRLETEQPSTTNAAPSSELDSLALRVNEAIEKTSKRYLDVQTHTPWQIIHGLLALRRDFELRSGDATVNAVEWMSNAARYKGTYIFEATNHGGRAQPYNGTMYDFEGHPNQTLALMCMSNLPLTHVFTVAGGRKLTMADMIRHAQMTVNTQEETTWTLWLLTHYLDQDTQWVNQWGQKWSIETLVHIQNQVDVTKAACGGTHNLFALAYARNAYLQKYGQLRGVWMEADQKLQRQIATVRALQNVDGSFSTLFFKGPGHSTEFNERIKSSGHNLEWLMMALPQNRLQEEWVQRGVESLANDLMQNASLPAECGPLYHSLHALVLYHQRVAPESLVSPDRPLARRTKPDIVPGPLTSNGADEEAAPRNAQPEPPVIVSQPKPLASPAKTAPAPKPLSPDIKGRPAAAQPAPEPPAQVRGAIAAGPSEAAISKPAGSPPAEDSSQQDDSSTVTIRPSLEAPGNGPKPVESAKISTPKPADEASEAPTEKPHAPDAEKRKETAQTPNGPAKTAANAKSDATPAIGKGEEESPATAPRPAVARPPGNLTFLRPVPPRQSPEQKDNSSDAALRNKPGADNTTPPPQKSDREGDELTQLPSGEDAAIGPIPPPPKIQPQHAPQQAAPQVPRLKAPADLFVPLNRKYLRMARRGSRTSFEVERELKPNQSEEGAQRQPAAAP